MKTAVGATVTALLMLIPAFAGTELRIHAVDQRGKAVPITVARLYLIAWGGVKTVDLTPERGSVCLDLSAEWAAKTWPERSRDLESGIVYVESPGHAGIQSDPFTWLGGFESLWGKPLRISRATLRFPNGDHITVPEGESRKLTLHVRKSVERMLQFVDDVGTPVNGVSTTVSQFITNRNHSGGAIGDQIRKGTTGADGRLVVPDGDFPYVIEAEKQHYVYENPEWADIPPCAITRLTARETVLKLHERKLRPLKLLVLRDGLPVKEVSIAAWLADCPGGGCAGEIAKTGPDGTVSIQEFYPEEWEFVFIPGEKGYPYLWKEDPKTWPANEVVTINLSK